MGCSKVTLWCFPMFCVLSTVWWGITIFKVSHLHVFGIFAQPKPPIRKSQLFIYSFSHSACMTPPDVKYIFKNWYFEACDPPVYEESGSILVSLLNSTWSQTNSHLCATCVHRSFNPTLPWWEAMFQSSIRRIPSLHFNGRWIITVRCCPRFLFAFILSFSLRCILNTGRRNLLPVLYL